MRERVIEYPILCEHKEERHYKFSVYARHFAIQKVNSCNTFLNSFQFDCTLDQWLDDNRRNLWSPTRDFVLFWAVAIAIIVAVAVAKTSY